MAPAEDKGARGRKGESRGRRPWLAAPARARWRHVIRVDRVATDQITSDSSGRKVLQPAAFR